MPIQQHAIGLMTSTPDSLPTDARESGEPWPRWLEPLSLEEERVLNARLAPGGARLREGLCSVPFWNDGALSKRAKAQAAGQCPDLAEAHYWMGVSGNQINLELPRTETSDAVAAYWLGLLDNELEFQMKSQGDGSSTAEE